MENSERNILNDVKHRIKTIFEDSVRVKMDFLEEAREIIPQMAYMLDSAFRKGNKALVCGNGGSAADSQHLAAELVGRFLTERIALPCIALSTDTSILTAVGNDYGFDRVFSRQVEALGKPGDVVIGISTSGNSPNVLQAFRQARTQQCQVIAIGGRDGGHMKDMADLSLIVPSMETPRIQECHELAIHVLCSVIDDLIAENPL